MLLYIFAFYFLYTFSKLKSYFISKIGKDLFNKDVYDLEVFLNFAWMIPLKFLFLKSELNYVLICDQVSRHVFRFLKNRFIDPKSLSLKAFYKIQNLNFENYDTNTLVFFSLCIRHATRDYNLDSNILDNIINTIERKNNIIININDHNRRTLRCYNTVKENSDTMIRKEYIKNEELHNYVVNKILTMIPKNSHIVLLCSGGVDSMTLAHIFDDISKTISYTFSIFHIDWKKRLESTNECNALQEYFSNFNIPFETVEYTGDKNDPNWDNNTTAFRFQQLNQIKQRYQPNNTYFVMGHVIEDLVENLFMNTLLNNSKGTNFLTIFGMKELSEIHDVYIFRPLLLHTKPTNSVSHFVDNAKDLMVTRRMYRRQIKEFSVERIQQLYYQSLAVCDFFDKENFWRVPYRIFKNAPSIGIQKFYNSLGLIVSLKEIENTKFQMKNQERKKGFPIRIEICNKDYYILHEDTRVIMFYKNNMY